MGISNLPSTAALSSPPQNALDLPELDHGIGTEQGVSIDTEDKRRAGSHKRKRKTEKQLACLQAELRGSNLLWSRQKIIQISERTGMSETQIYKWWWDQTRKRMKKLKNCSKDRLSVDGSHS